MNASLTLQPSDNPTSVSASRPKRPKVRFQTPAELRGFKEQIWEINAALVDWSRAEFEADFDKAALYAVFYVEDDVVGISTVMEAEFEVAGRRVFTIGLGRAVVKHAYRNQFLVQRALIFRWIRKFLRKPLQPIYIWGSCVSYKSYLSFVKVLKVVYPVTETTTPARHAEVIDKIGSHWYGGHYIAASKVVRVPNFKVSDAAVVPSQKDLEDPAIRFYFDRVPQAQDATYGLLTISPCIRSNFLPMVGSWVRNFFRKALGLGGKRR